MSDISDIINDPNWNDPKAPEYQKPYNPTNSISCGCKGNLGQFIDIPPLELNPPLETEIVISRLTR